jgi:GGDEF domain-containing protein
VEEFIKQADDAMYSAKKAGKGCYRFSPEHTAAVPA